MIRKLLILGLILICFITFPNSSVIAADEEHILNDDSGDVFEYEDDFQTHPEVEDIDITQIVYSKTGKSITLDINFRGRITKPTSISLVIFVLLYTSEQEYQIFYFSALPPIGEEVNGSSLEGPIEVSIDGFNTKKLTFTFDLENESEVYEEIIITTLKQDIDMTYSYSDIYPNEEFLVVDAGGDIEGKVGESISFSGSVSSGTPPYTWTWDFDDGEISEEQNPKHTYTEEGIYQVELYVIDDEEAEGFDIITVTITGSNGGNGNGNNGGNNNEPTGSGLLIFIVLIVIIVIVAVAVVFYVIKK